MPVTTEAPAAMEMREMEAVLAQGSNNNTGSNTNTAALSADNSLKALTISPGTLSPAFKGSTTKYTAAVDNSVTSIAVSATPVNERQPLNRLPETRIIGRRSECL